MKTGLRPRQHTMCLAPARANDGRRMGQMTCRTGREMRWIAKPYE